MRIAIVLVTTGVAMVGLVLQKPFTNVLHANKAEDLAFSQISGTKKGFSTKVTEEQALLIAWGRVLQDMHWPATNPLIYEISASQDKDKWRINLVPSKSAYMRYNGRHRLHLGPLYDLQFSISKQDGKILHVVAS